ncbi:MAG TPA: hypothetical protein VEC35_04575 [Noviherbaspirillum sp.]|nr:hypothetical protein [Noviherbaspirillum sp.]
MSAVPAARAIEETAAAAAILPQVEADIASVFLTRLEGLFAREALGLAQGAPHAGSFPARIGKTEFWTCALCRKDQARSSAAARFYLDDRFQEMVGMRFRDYCQIWGQSFFATRHDFDSARDILLLFLDQNLDLLKRLYILDQPHNRDLAPDAQALERCFEAPDNAMLFVGDRFSRWVLDEWLPFQLRYVCCRQFVPDESTSECQCLIEVSGDAPSFLN